MARAETDPTIDDAAPKATSSYWMLLKDAYQQFRKLGLEPREAGQRLIDLLCQWPLMPCKIRYVNSGREEILSVEDWQNEVITLSVEIDPTTGVDYLGIYYTAEYRHPGLPDDPAEFLVPAANVARERERLTATSPVKQGADTAQEAKQQTAPKAGVEAPKNEAAE
jgi:hypothetical protein